jgi:polyferredoxin
LNLSIFVAVVGLTLLAKKSFCGWVCPIGFLGETAGKLGAKLIPGRPRPGARLDGRLRMLRYAVLVIALSYTYRTGELILRGYDPYYAIFSGLGHGTLATITVVVLGVLFAGALIVPMFFCRYLCPLGAALDPFSRLGFIKISRRTSDCTGCGLCTAACPHALSPHEVELMRHRDCTNCLECIEACPAQGVLDLKLTL